MRVNRPKISISPRFQASAGAAIFFSLFAASAQGQTIIRASETVLPGEAINIVGDGFDSSCTVSATSISSNGSAGQSANVPVTAVTPYLIQGTIPSNMPGRLWRLKVSKGSLSSNYFYINRVRPVFVDADSVAPTGLVTVYGRNLTAAGGSSIASTARFVSSTGTSLAATVVSRDKFSLTLRAPTGIKAATPYTLRVSNGLGGTTGEAICPGTIVGRAAASDPFNLNVPWGSDFKYSANVYNIKTDSRLTYRATGNGTADDTDALFWAIDTAWHAGGGVVYLPAGQYKINNGVRNIIMRPNVVLKGDGPGQTVLQYGYRYTPTSPAPAGDTWMVMRQCDLSGLLNLSVQNLNTGPSLNGFLLTGNQGLITKRLFFKNVNFDLGNGYPVTVQSIDKVLVDGCTVNSRSTQSGAFGFTANSWGRLINTTVNYRNGRVQGQMNRQTVIQNNQFVRDTTYDTVGSIESGGLETSFGRQLVVKGNNIFADGPTPTKPDTDGETLGSQRAIVSDFEDVGKATAATSQTLTDSTKAWPTRDWHDQRYLAFNRTMVAIVDGKGVGQWRYVTSHTSTTMSLDRPWDVIPNNTSRYAIGSWTSDTQLFLNNVTRGNHSGMGCYDGAWDLVVDGNQQLNCGVMNIRTISWPLNQAGWSTTRTQPAWNVWVGNNTVTNTNGWRPAQIVVMSIDGSGSTTPNGCGSLQLGTEVRNNTVIAGTPNISRSTQWGDEEGFWNSGLIIGPWSSPMGNVGTLYSNNQSQNLATTFRTRGQLMLQVANQQIAAVP